MKIPIVCLWVVFAISSAAASEAETATEKVWEIEVVPSRNSKGKGAILYATKPQDHFFVILRNVSGKEQRVWRDWSPWGYNNLSIVILLEDGKEINLTRNPNKWGKSYPDASLVPAGKSYVFPIHLAGKTWKGLHTVPAKPFKMTVKFQVKPTPEAVKKKVWVGSASSSAKTFTLRK